MYSLVLVAAATVAPAALVVALVMYPRLVQVETFISMNRNQVLRDIMGKNINKKKGGGRASQQ